ncbi:MAG: hypothetical protein ACLQPD_28520 [Desulfomonilaceae bacterium]
MKSPGGVKVKAKVLDLEKAKVKDLENEKVRGGSYLTRLLGWNNLKANH